MFGKIKEKWNGMSNTKKGVITIVGFAAVGALAKFAIYKALEDNHESANDVEMVAAEETLIDVGSDDIIE